MMDSGVMQDVQYAGFADRTAAFIIDAIIVGTLFCYLLEGVVYSGSFIGPVLFSGFASGPDGLNMAPVFGSILTGSILLVLLCWLYSAGVTSSQYGGTFGKMIMGMKVVDTSGDRLSFRHATFRFIAKIFSGLVLCIGFFMIHFSPTRQGLHDRFCGTYVVYGKKAVPVSPDAGPTIIATLTAAEEKKADESRKNTRKVMVWLVAIPLFFILVTVVLAAVIAGFVFGMAGNVSHTYVVAATAQQIDASTIILTYQGGQDAAELKSIKITVNGESPVIWESPGIGEKKVFSDGTPGKDHVIMTGTFTSGAEQVILDTYI